MKKTVYVVGFEGNSHLGNDYLATSSFHWYDSDIDAKAAYNRMFNDKQLMNGGKTSLYGGSVEVSSIDPDDITDEVEKYLEENGWEAAFNTKNGNLLRVDAYNSI